MWLYIIGGILLVLAVGVWYVGFCSDPERVFWKTIEQGLATNAVTIQAKQTANGTTANQMMQFSLGANNLSRSLTTMTQQGTIVKSEMVATPTDDYTRYLQIKTDQKKADGGVRDFSKVIGVWAQGLQGSGQLFAQTVFGVSLPVGGMGVPIGNLAPKARADLMTQIKHDGVYKIVFGKVKKERVAGRTQYTYDALVTPSAYVALMKRYAQSVGLHGLDQLNPADFAGQKAFTLRITVDTRAHHVVRITAPDNGSTQAYMAYDVPVQITVPSKAISATALQQLLAGQQ